MQDVDPYEVVARTRIEDWKTELCVLFCDHFLDNYYPFEFCDISMPHKFTTEL